VVKGDAAADLTVDLRSFPRGRGRIEVEIEGSHDQVDVVSDTDVEVSAPEPAPAEQDSTATRLLISSLLAILRIAAPQFVAKIEAIGSTIVVTGHIDLTETGASLELTAQRVSAEDTEIATTGAVTLTAIATNAAAADALVSLRNATIFGGDVSLTATADGKSSATAVVSVIDSRITATGDVEVTADATLTATGGSAVSVAAARLIDSAVKTPGDLAITARNVTALASEGDTGASLSKLTSAAIAGDSSVAAAAVLLTAVATGELKVRSAGSATARFAALAEAGLDPAATLVLSGGDLVVRASSRHTTRVRGKGLVIAVTDARTLAALAPGALVVGARDLQLLADSTDVTVAEGDAAALVSSLVQTHATLAAGAPIVLADDLSLVAVQRATATAEGAGVVVVLADHDVAAELLRSATAGGSLLATSDGVSELSSRAAAGTWSQPATDVLVPFGGLPGLPVVIPVRLSAQATLSGTVDSRVSLAPGLGIVAPGGAELRAVAGGSATAVAGSGSAFAGPAVAINDTAFGAATRLGSPVHSDTPVVDYSGRGPPAVEFTTRAPVAVDLTRSSAIPTTPRPAGAVLVLAALGGTLSAPGATLSFAPGALPSNAWVTITPRSATVSGVRLASPVYDLTARDAATGQAITHFAVAPRLTIQVSTAAATAVIYYIDESGAVQQQPTRYDAAAGVLVADLPHFSNYAAGSPLDLLVGWIVDRLNEATVATSIDLLPGVSVTGLTLSATIPASGSGPRTGTASGTGVLAIDLAGVTGSGTVTIGYSLVNQALDAGALTVTVTDLVLSIGGVIDLTATGASLGQSGTDLTLVATGVTAGSVGGQVSLVAGTANLRLATAGVAGSVAGTVALALPGVALVSGTIGLSLDTAASTAAFTGSGVTLTVLGQSLAGNVSITRTGGQLVVDVTAAAFGFADGSVRLTAGTAHLVVPDAGELSGTVGGQLQLSVPGVTVSGSFAATLAGGTTPTVEITGADVVVGLDGLSLQAATVTLARTGATTLAVGGASLTLGPAAAPFLSMTGISATLTLGAAGVRASLTASASLLVPGLVTAAPQVTLEVDTVAARSRVVLTVADTPADRLQVAGLGTLAGTLSFTRSADETVIGLAGVVLRIAGGAQDGVEVTGAEGVLVVRQQGVAGYLSGTLSAGLAGSGVTGTVAVRLNTMVDTAIDTAVTVGGQPVAVRFPSAATAVLEVSLSGASLKLGDFVSIEGTLTFTAGRFAGTGLKVFLGRGPATLADGSANPLAVGVLLTNASLGLVRSGTEGAYTYALVASGSVAIVGVPGV
ncbi:MAG: hypothetical protein AAGC63_16170, partial [Propionicimonas sp.]